ncbi:hypothetical protein [Nocardia crassostreae]|uniref:hypothetical protein n=1 Tax=Nocardia crassostreae TaxID=53428 RepID=UPI0012FA6A10|nr:hypothetical protein [Nocardia crassostreae]
MSQAPDERTPDRVSIVEWLARGIAIAVFIPLRLLWEGLRLVVRVTVRIPGFLADRLLAPIAKFTWVWIARPAWGFVKNYLWGLLLQQLLWGMILTPVGAFLLDFLLRPLQRAIEQWLWRRALLPTLRFLGLALAALVRYVLWPPIEWSGTQLHRLWRHVLRPGLIGGGRWINRWLITPAVHALGWILRFIATRLIAWPLRMLWQWLLAPLLILLAAAVYYGWRGATVVVNAVVVTPCRFLYRTVLQPLFAAIATAWQATVVRPGRWVYRRIVAPMNKWVADIMSAVFGH